MVSDDMERGPTLSSMGEIETIYRNVRWLRDRRAVLQTKDSMVFHRIRQLRLVGLVVSSLTIHSEIGSATSSRCPQQPPNNRIRSACQLRCASSAAGYAPR